MFSAAALRAVDRKRMATHLALEPMRALPSLSRELGRIAMPMPWRPPLKGQIKETSQRPLGKPVCSRKSATPPAMIRLTFFGSVIATSTRS